MNDIDRQIMELLQEKERQRLEAGRRAGNYEQDHQPVYYVIPGEMYQVGCSCGHRAKKPNLSMNSMFNSYAVHRHHLGLSKLNYYNPRFTEGPAKGMTWDEAKAAGVDMG